MIYPDFNKLLSLQHQAKKLKSSFKDISLSKTSGNNSSKQYGSGLEFAEVREYVFGDDVRDIDWRVTARTGKVHSKLFQIENEQTINIAIDINPSMYFGTTKTFKSIQAAKILALIGWFNNFNGNRVGGVVFGSPKKSIEIFKPSKNRKSLLKLLKSLTLEQIGEKYIPICDALSSLNKVLTTNSRIYIISDFNNFDQKEFEKSLIKLQEKKHKTILIKITDKRDCEIPAIGEISFVNNLGEKVIINTNTNSGRNKYQKIWEENHYNLKNSAKKTNSKLIEINTDENINHAISKVYL